MQAEVGSIKISTKSYDFAKVDHEIIIIKKTSLISAQIIYLLTFKSLIVYMVLETFWTLLKDTFDYNIIFLFMADQIFSYESMTPDLEQTAKCYMLKEMQEWWYVLSVYLIITKQQ